MASDNREDLLVRVATLYYEEDLNQQQIAGILEREYARNFSRSNVSRLLKEAKEKGLVQIHIRKPIATAPSLEREFRERFSLQQAMIVANRGQNALVEAGQLAARYLEMLLRPGDVMSISWGTGVSAAVNALPPNPSLHVEVVQMIGSVGTVDPAIDGHELARVLANKLGGRYHYLHAPLFVDSQAARDLFLEQPTICEALNRARRATVALVGIGTTESLASSFLRAGHMTEAQLAGLRKQGAVGETSGWHFDINGNASDFDINCRVIALDLDSLRRIPNVVAVACGLLKRRAILAILRGGYINALATDDVTAAAVLAEADNGL